MEKQHLETVIKSKKGLVLPLVSFGMGATESARGQIYHSRFLVATDHQGRRGKQTQFSGERMVLCTRRLRFCRGIVLMGLMLVQILR